MRRRVAWLLAAVTVLAVLLLFVLPGRTLLRQRASLQRTERQLQALRAEDAHLQQTAAALRSDAEIERLARQRYGLVRPGEQAYVVLPRRPATTPVPPTP